MSKSFGLSFIQFDDPFHGVLCHVLLYLPLFFHLSDCFCVILNGVIGVSEEAVKDSKLSHVILFLAEEYGRGVIGFVCVTMEFISLFPGSF